MGHRQRKVRMPHLLSRFVLDASGVTGIEYALIASLISIVIIAGSTAVGSSLDTTYQAVATAVAGSG